MATDLLNLAVPGLGSTLKLLHQLYDKYDQVKKGRELCTSLHRRLEDFAKLLNDIAPDVRQQEALLPRLQQLIEDFVATVSTFAQQNYVRQLRRQTQFEEDIKIFNERLDDVVKMLTVKHTEKLSQLLDWRTHYEQHTSAVLLQLEDIQTVQREIWSTLDVLANGTAPDPAATRTIKGEALLAKRDVAYHASEATQPALQQVVAIAEQYFLDNQRVQTPPNWLIASDEVQLTEPPIDSQGLTSIYVGRWEGIEVAVKRFEALDDVDDSPVFDKHFVVWESLKHRHVAQLYGVGTDNGAPFFVYEFAGRQSLDRCWSHFELVELWRLLHHAALGLRYLHNQKVVHGNLSCSKLLVTAHATVKLFGFGASYVRENNQSNSLKPELREEFAAPECIGLSASGRRTGARHSPRFESDVYSFGLTIVEAVLRKDPFAGLSLGEIRELKRSAQLPRPKGLDDATWGLVQRMCVCDPTKRVSLGFVAQELKRLATQRSKA